MTSTTSIASGGSINRPPPPPGSASRLSASSRKGSIFSKLFEGLAISDKHTPAVLEQEPVTKESMEHTQATNSEMAPTNSKVQGHTDGRGSRSFSVALADVFRGSSGQQSSPDRSFSQQSKDSWMKGPEMDEWSAARLAMDSRKNSDSRKDSQSRRESEARRASDARRLSLSRKESFSVARKFSLFGSHNPDDELPLRGASITSSGSRGSKASPNLSDAMSPNSSRKASYVPRNAHSGFMKTVTLLTAEEKAKRVDAARAESLAGIEAVTQHDITTVPDVPESVEEEMEAERVHPLHRPSLGTVPAPASSSGLGSFFSSGRQPSGLETDNTASRSMRKFSQPDHPKQDSIRRPSDGRKSARKISDASRKRSTSTITGVELAPDQLEQWQKSANKTANSGPYLISRSSDSPKTRSAFSDRRKMPEIDDSSGDEDAMPNQTTTAFSKSSQGAPVAQSIRIATVSNVSNKKYLDDAISPMNLKFEVNLSSTGGYGSLNDRSLPQRDPSELEKLGFKGAVPA